MCLTPRFKEEFPLHNIFNYYFQGSATIYFGEVYTSRSFRRMLNIRLTAKGLTVYVTFNLCFYGITKKGEKKQHHTEKHHYLFSCNVYTGTKLIYQINFDTVTYTLWKKLRNIKAYFVLSYVF